MICGSSRGQRNLAESQSPLELSSLQISPNMHFVGERQRQADADLLLWNHKVACCLNKNIVYFTEKTFHNLGMFICIMYLCTYNHVQNHWNSYKSPAIIYCTL